MKYEVQCNSEARSVELTIAEGRLRATIDGRVSEADAVEVEPDIYSILIYGNAFEVRVEPELSGARVHVGVSEYLLNIRDPRQWQRDRGTALEADGRQELIAPMPGKIVRVLVKSGDTVESGQGVLVVEAMKMQNEIRSPKSGIVERIVVVEGQTVNAGEVLGTVA